MTNQKFINKTTSNLGFVKVFVDKQLHDNDKKDKIKKLLGQLQQEINFVNEGDLI